MKHQNSLSNLLKQGHKNGRPIIWNNQRFDSISIFCRLMSEIYNMHMYSQLAHYHIKHKKLFQGHEIKYVGTYAIKKNPCPFKYKEEPLIWNSINFDDYKDMSKRVDCKKSEIITALQEDEPFRGHCIDIAF